MILELRLFIPSRAAVCMGIMCHIAEMKILFVDFPRDSAVVVPLFLFLQLSSARVHVHVHVHAHVHVHVPCTEQL